MRCSMGGRGRCLDNAFIERLWRSLKYEAVYLHELADGFEAQRVIAEWIDYYNEERPHSALAGRTPAEAYRNGMTDSTREVALRTSKRRASRTGRASGRVSREEFSTYSQARSPPPSDPHPRYRRLLFRHGRVG